MLKFQLVKKLRFIILFSVLFLLQQHLSAQITSCQLRISVLTCSPADELYSTFGHTAIRVIDSSIHSDYVFNYGTFNFDDPDFYTKFVRGKLDYALSVAPYNEFILEYIADKRTIYEQELILTCEQKQTIANALLSNLQGKNRYYKYDFLFDNCTTRVRDIIFHNVQSAQVKNPITPTGTTYRNMLYEYLDKGGKPWSKLGIDILLGSKTDKVVNIKQSMFLPEYLMKGVDSAVMKNNIHLASYHKVLLQETPPDTASWKYAPLLFSIIISTIIIILSFIKKNWATVATKITDSFLLYTTGIVGILLVFMWFGTDHIVCRNNFNLFWALPSNFFAAFLIWKKREIMKRYYLAASVITALLLVTWFIIPQHLNIALFPLAFAGLIRYIKLYQLQ
jgi:hypothetical protein